MGEGCLDRALTDVDREMGTHVQRVYSGSAARKSWKEPNKGAIPGVFSYSGSRSWSKWQLPAEEGSGQRLEEGHTAGWRAPRLPAARWMMLPLLRWRKTQGGSRRGLVMFERPVRHPSGNARYTLGVSLGPGLEAHIWESSGRGWGLEPRDHPEVTGQVKDGASLL